MKAVLLIDFGSTYTKITAVDVEKERILGTAQSFTTIETDINDGLNNALAILKEQIGEIEFSERYACSSAAGGLRMVAIGLVPELTAKAARQASLGAGAKVIKTYSYELTEGDLQEIDQINPDICLLTGGTDGGNKENIVFNAQMLAKAKHDFPIIIAGNRNCADKCQEILKDKQTYVCENVMPRLDIPNVEPVQKKIREIFLEQIVKAKGLSRAQDLIQGILMPTPSAMLTAMKLLAKGSQNEDGMGDLVGVDLGGATTDVYSMSFGLPTMGMTALKGLPLAYNKDMQEDKEAVFDALDTVTACLTPFIPMIDTMKVLPENMRKAAAAGFINATDCADYLVGKGLPFRDAYKATGTLVARCIEEGLTLETLPLSSYKEICPLFEEDVYDFISLERCAASRRVYGGPAPENVLSQVKRVRGLVG